MDRTSRMLATSKNPSMLEIRIMTNHASDPKFAFLRDSSPLNRYWNDLRAGKIKKPSSVKIGLDIGYGSDSD